MYVSMYIHTYMCMYSMYVRVHVYRIERDAWAYHRICIITVSYSALKLYHLCSTLIVRFLVMRFGCHHDYAQ